MMVEVNQEEKIIHLDPDWIRLIKQARELGLTSDEIRIFMEGSKRNNEEEVLR